MPSTAVFARDLVGEAAAGLVQRPGRTVLTMAGTVLGVGAYVATLGLTASAAGQISAAFTLQDATTVTVTDVASEAAGGLPLPPSLPPDADAVARGLNGVEAAGTSWYAGSEGSTVATSLDPRLGVREGAMVQAVTPGYFDAIGAGFSSGAGFDEVHARLAARVAVLGRGIAERLGVSAASPRATVLVDSVPYTVVGVLRDAARDPAALQAVLVPAGTAVMEGGPTTSLAGQRMVVRTRAGAADVVASQLAVALRPDHPELLRVEHATRPEALQAAVSSSLSGLFVALAGVMLLIGAGSIANTTLVTVLERSGEIGLRRSLGAQRRHVAGQFLLEAGTVGVLGGLVGTAVGVAVVVGVALARHWTALLDPVVTLTAPLVGLAAGVLAGVYPAVQAARVEPVEALRR